MARVTLEGLPDGNVTINSQGVPAPVVERILIAALAGVQRELTARRVMELRDEARLRAQLTLGGVQ